MLNSKVKKEAIEELKRAGQDYAKLGEMVQQNAINLLEMRKQSSSLIINIETYVNSIANTPKEFESSIEEVKIHLQKFKAILDIKYDEAKANHISGSIAGAGVAVGAGVAALGPTAAMAAATTFGVASTGTAISALSGAAATNAALAWLGGGALAAGGGGMAAGNAFLAMAGPIGWAIGGTAIVGGALFANKKNKEIAIKAQKETVNIRKNIAVLKAANVEITELILLTTEHNTNLNRQLNILTSEAPKDYRKFTTEQKHEIGSLVHNTLSLSKLINKKVGK